MTGRMTITKPAAAGVSIASNAILIALKLAAAAITGSIAILSEALHSMIDLIASVIAFVAVRRADEPADEEHPYGHQKMESVAASIEGMLILVGAGIIIFESVAPARERAPRSRRSGVGIAVIAFSAVANAGVAYFLRDQARKPRLARRSPATPPTWAPTRSPRSACWSGLVLVEVDGGGGDRLGRRDRGRHGDRLRRGPDHAPRLGRAGGRGAAARGDGPDRGRDRRRPPAGDGRLPPAPRPDGRQPPLHRPPRPVQGRHHARARPRRWRTPSATRSSPSCATPRC